MNSIFRYSMFIVLTVVICKCEGHLPILDALISGVQKTRMDFREASHKIFETLRPHSDISIKFETHLGVNRGQGNVMPPYQPTYPEQPVNIPDQHHNVYPPHEPPRPIPQPPHRQPDYTPPGYNNEPNIPNEQVYDGHRPHGNNNNYNHHDHSPVIQNNGNTNQNYDHDSDSHNKNQNYDKNGHYNEDKLKTQQTTNKPDYEVDLSSIFGTNKKYTDNGYNSNDFDNKNKDDKPLYVALNPKRETVESEKNKDEEDEFPIDVRFNKD